MEEEKKEVVYKFTEKDDVITKALSELFSYKFDIPENNNNYCILNGTLKIPNAKKFAEGGFKRYDVMMLIDIFKVLLDVQINGGELYPKFGDIINHFARNGAYSALTGEDNKKERTYFVFTELIKSVIEMDDKQRLYFIKRLQDIFNLEKKGTYIRKEGYNLIDVMYEEAEKVLSEANINIKEIEDQKKN